MKDRLRPLNIIPQGKGTGATEVVRGVHSDRTVKEGCGQGREVGTSGDPKTWNREMGRASGCTLPPLTQQGVLFSSLNRYAQTVLEV